METSLIFCLWLLIGLCTLKNALWDLVKHLQNPADPQKYLQVSFVAGRTQLTFTEKEFAY